MVVYSKGPKISAFDQILEYVVSKFESPQPWPLTAMYSKGKFFLAFDQILAYGANKFESPKPWPLTAMP